MATGIDRATPRPVDAEGLRVVRDWARGLVDGDLKVVETMEVPQEPDDDTLYVVVDTDGDEEAVTYHICTGGTLRQVETGGVKDYEMLDNKPSIEGNILAGDKTLDELGITAEGLDVTAESLGIGLAKEYDIYSLFH